MLLLIPRSGGKQSDGDAASAILPPPWRIQVTVLNGSGDINYTRQVASRIGAFGYGIKKVTRAKNFTYPQTAVYFPPKLRGRRGAPRESNWALRRSPSPAAPARASST